MSLKVGIVGLPNVGPRIILSNIGNLLIQPMLQSKNLKGRAEVMSLPDRGGLWD